MTQFHVISHLFVIN